MTPQKPGTVLDGSAEYIYHNLRHTFSKYQFAIILKIKVALSNDNIQSFVSSRPRIKYSTCIHWIVLNYHKVSDGFYLDILSKCNPNVSRHRS